MLKIWKKSQTIKAKQIWRSREKTARKEYHAKHVTMPATKEKRNVRVEEKKLKLGMHFEWNNNNALICVRRAAKIDSLFFLAAQHCNWNAVHEYDIAYIYSKSFAYRKQTSDSEKKTKKKCTSNMKCYLHCAYAFLLWSLNVSAQESEVFFRFLLFPSVCRAIMKTIMSFTQADIWLWQCVCTHTHSYALALQICASAAAVEAVAALAQDMKIMIWHLDGFFNRKQMHHIYMRSTQWTAKLTRVCRER